ncbi:MAG: type II toxin-antitoxin system VapC family toxin [Deltaproteobacteria bacterium]|nr:type II toxin-antitoxin system VapC family toxin [Deltaproteobacteria bacterium]MBW1795620.1 type II toxin-antitoxin system VapC family toxin [Deltaproteobacteria bacterium]
MKSSQNEKTEYEQNYFFDTSALIKLYHHEEGTEWVDRIFDQEICSIIISELATIEIYSGLARKLRMQEITKQAKHEAIENFHKDCKMRFIIAPLSGMVVRKARGLIKAHGDTKRIRTLDALQLASCLLEKHERIVFVCADKNLIQLAKLEAVTGINPEVGGSQKTSSRN